MKVSLRLLAVELHYPPELRLHTAASGLVDSLSERYLEIERSDGFRGVGEVRANITYLSKMPEAAVDPAIRSLCKQLPWTESPEEVLSTLHKLMHRTPHVASAIIENALLDGAAKQKLLSVAELFGGTWQSKMLTNQCLFWSPDETFDRLTARFLAEGFRQIKVRIGIAGFDADLARLKRLRERAPSSISIAADANGAWSAEEAIEKLRQLEGLNLSYVEQPTHPGDWTAFARAQKNTIITLMADEGLANDGDIDQLARIGAPALAHLKIVKLGGPSAVIDAARRLTDAGVDVMIGQMNEGAMATAITAHCAMALQPRYAELYGCYGLLDDVTSGVSYVNGEIVVPAGPGLGVNLDTSRCREVWTERLTS